MPSSVQTTAVVGANYQVSVLHPSGTVYVPRFRNVLPPAGYADLPTYQVACQAAALALIDATTTRPPNATAALLHLR